MNHLKTTLPRVVLVAMALVLVLGAIPAQAAKSNLAPAINLGPLSHREELRANVNAKVRLARVELRIDNKKVQPWVKAHAGWKYTVRYPLNKVSTGMHRAKLQVWDQKNRSSQRQWQFQKLAQLALSADKSSVQPGEKVVLKGQGFMPGTAVVIGMGVQNSGAGGNYGTAVADRQGTFTVAVTLDKLPDGTPISAGTFILVAHNSDGSEKASIHLRVLPAPKISLDQNSIKSGDEVRVTGEGFTPGVAVSISLGGLNTGAGGNYGSTMTDSAGQFELKVRLAQLPDGSPLFAGPVVLVAHTADFQEKATVQLQILADPSIALDKAAIKSGERVTVSGKGFTPGASVSIALGGVNAGAGGNYGNATVEASGLFSLDVLLDRYPDGTLLKPGPVVLLAHTADFAERASAQLQVQTSPTLSASKTVVRVGEWVILNGEGFTPAKVATIRLAGIDMGHGTNYGTAAVDANGRFSTQLFLGRYPDGTLLPPGGITLMVTTPDGEHAQVGLQVVADPAITATPTSIRPGDAITLRGEGFAPGSTMILSMAPSGVAPEGNFGSALVDASGRFVLTAKLTQYPGGSPLQPGPLMLVVHDASGSQRAAVQIQILDRAPSAASDLRLTSLTKGGTSAESATVGLQWRDNASNETGFRIQATYTRMNGGTDSQLWSVPTNATSVQVSFVAGGINPMTKACFTVTAFNGQGDSSPSNQVCAAL